MKSNCDWTHIVFPVTLAPFNRCYSVADGTFVKDVNLIDVVKAENPKWQSVSLANTGRNIESVSHTA